MKANYYRVLEDCVERGILGGVLNEDLTVNRQVLVDELTQRVMNEIDEYFTFGENDD